MYMFIKKTMDLEKSKFASAVFFKKKHNMYI